MTQILTYHAFGKSFGRLNVCSVGTVLVKHRERSTAMKFFIANFNRKVSGKFLHLIIGRRQKCRCTEVNKGADIVFIISQKLFDLIVHTGSVD